MYYRYCRTQQGRHERNEYETCKHSRSGVIAIDLLFKEPVYCRSAAKALGDYSLLSKAGVTSTCFVGYSVIYTRHLSTRIGGAPSLPRCVLFWFVVQSRWPPRYCPYTNREGECAISSVDDIATKQCSWGWWIASRLL